MSEIRTSARLLDLPSPDVAERIAQRPLAVIPFGSTEQHGPHLPVGTDTFAADLISAAAAVELGGLLVPFGPYGVTPLHAGTPGTISLRPETFEALAHDLCSELAGMGVEEFVFVNWHEMNSPSLDRVATDVQAELGTIVVVAQACYVAQRLYASSGGRLTHGGSIEALSVLAHDPALARLDRVQAAALSEHATELDAMRRSHEVYGVVTEIGEFGGDGWYGDPHWAVGQAPETFATTVGSELVAEVEKVLAVRRRHKQPVGRRGAR
ncbi:MAG: creatininase family protein [Solirubrobacteraceae bacterium]